ncbi:sulfotransferase [Actibacterium atlanticum]|uniref:Sulfotransferase n=1 Tax=Actibacterium atlanticum TaxID=1461693 RepID=A0A058ZIX7_9RHOB|nr:tetratricopeptide repeat-containing sulfotransferase family protein [Actibacterium atlanticum]KCV81579.1 sulfotransferase [Actibacterium atlanticum]
MALAPTPIRDLFRRAMQAQNNGKADLARELYGQILKANPKLPEVHYQLGRLEMGLERPRQALRHLKTARKIKSDEPVIWTTMMDAYLALKDRQSAKVLLAESKKGRLPFRVVQELENKLKTENREGVGQLGSIDKAVFEHAAALYQSGKAAEAENAAKAMLAGAPNVAPALALLGAAQATQGKSDEAKNAYRKAIAVDPNYVEAHAQFGQLLMHLDEKTEARKHLEVALSKAPKSAEANRHLGLLEASERAFAKAVPLLAAAQKQFPNDARLLIALSNSQRETGELKQARLTIEHALDHCPISADILRTQGSVLAELDENEAALNCFKKAHDMAPDDIAILNALTWHHQLMGNFEETSALSMELFERGHMDGGLYRRYVTGHKATANDPLAQAMQDAFETGREVEGTREPMAFALAKVKEDLKDHSAAFKFLQEGNDGLRERYPVAAENFMRPAELSEKAFERGLPDLPTTTPKLNPAPLFVCGMPRSGTTLVEQIVASHSLVTAGGELGHMNTALIDPLALRDAANNPLQLSDLTAALSKANKKYQSKAPDTPFVTDKGITTFMFTGLIRHLLPDSRIIVVRRDPRDNCLSMYKNMFVEGTHRYTTDLETLAKTYLSYLETLDYWRKATPGAFHEIRYEDLIGNPEEKARELIAECGLDWEDRCLEFYKNASKVKTLSVYQVRQPIYSSSVGAWKNFESELKPLIDILDKGGALEGW